jgi:hypothetical protein
VELTVFAASVGVGGEIAEEGGVKFTAGEAGVENFGVNASGDGAEMQFVKMADEFAGIALPNGEEGGHAKAGEIFFAVGAKVFEEDIAKGDFAEALMAEEAKGFFHASFVDGVDALRRNEDFMEREADGLGLLLEEFPADAVHGDAVVSFGDGGEQSDDVKILLLEQGVKGHGAVFAAAPAEEDGFRRGQENLQEMRVLPRRGARRGGRPYKRKV